MDKEKIKKLWLKSKEYNIILRLNIMIFIYAIMLVIFYKMRIINEYRTIVLSLIILINTILTSRLLIKSKKIFYSKYGIDIRKGKKSGRKL